MKSIQNSSTQKKKKIEANEDGLPSLKKDLQNSLLFLQQSGANGDSLFDHLSNVISKVIDERPKNVVDYFEQFSERVRLEAFVMNENLLEEGYKEPARLAMAQKLLPKLIEKLKLPMNDAASANQDEDDEKVLEQSPDDDDDADGEGEDVIYYEPPARDLWELQFYWNLLGIGFPREEVFSIALSVARLKTNPTIVSSRFWGKILGLKKDYYIVEALLSTTTTARRSTLENQSDAIAKAINITSLAPSEEFIPTSISSDTSANKELKNNDDKDNGSDLRAADVEEYPAGWNFSMKVLESEYRTPVELPAEKTGHGVNRHVFFVCTDLNDEWMELPPATPHQINVSRRIKKYLTGDLDEAITSHPKFPGTEQNYLRALIARISSGAHISPRSFHKIESNGIDGEETEADDNDHHASDDDDDATLNNDKPIKVNESYRPLPMNKLLKLDNWVHHKPEILKQGRVAYFDGRLLNNEQGMAESEEGSDVSDDEDETDVTNNNESKPEIPIPLFRSCSGDQLINDGMSPWTIRLSDASETLVAIQSHVWPGAFAFIKDRTCDNIYIGYGHKYSSDNYSPLALPEMASEFAFVSELFDGDDPTVAEEAAHAAAQTNELTDNVNSDDEDNNNNRNQ